MWRTLGRALFANVRLLVAPSAEQIMAMPAPAEARRRWTTQEVRELMDREPGHWPRYELIDGELLVSPSPRLRHDRALMWLYDTIAPFVKSHGLGRISLSPADIGLEAESIVQPDLFLIPADQDAAAREWSDVTGLRLVIEVLSEGTARYDRGEKREYYQRNGVDEYWIVDLDARLVERWRPNDTRPEILRDRVIWDPAGASAALSIDLAELWAMARLE
jgi:Uma2 family endonuclease